MWHSAAKIGVNEIDMGHANIDYVIRAISNDCGSESLVKQLVPAFIAHIKHEEKTIERMGHEFPDDHRKEHMLLAIVLRSLESDLNENKIDTYKFAQEIRTMLVLHVLDFDVKLLRPYEKHY